MDTIYRYLKYCRRALQTLFNQYEDSNLEEAIVHINITITCMTKVELVNKKINYNIGKKTKVK